MRRGASLCAFLLALNLATSCEDEDAQVLPPLLDAGELLVLDAGALERDAADDDVADVDAPSEGDAAEQDVSDDDAGLALADAGVDAGGPETGELDAPGPEVPEDVAAEGRDDEVFGGEEASSDLEGTEPGGGRPGMQREGVQPEDMQRGVQRPGVPPYAGVPIPGQLFGQGFFDPLPLGGGELFDVASLASGYTAVVMKNVALRLDEDINVFVVSLSGVLVPLGMGLVDLDEPLSLQLVVDEAEVRISEEDLNRLFTRYLFDGEDSFGGDRLGSEGPLRDVSVELAKGRLRLRGSLREDGDDIEVRGTLEPTPGGDVALHPTSLRREEKPVPLLDDIFEEGLSGVGVNDVPRGGSFGGGFGGGGMAFGGALAAPSGPAVWLEADALFFDPEAILPGPLLEAEVIDVTVRGSYVRLLLEGPAPEVKTLGPPDDVKNYVELRGGALRFGKLVMQRADVLLMDADASDPFDLSLRDYDQQMVAGTTQVRSDLGLALTLPDFDEITDLDLEEDDPFGDDADGNEDEDEDEDAGDDDSDDDDSDDSDDSDDVDTADEEE